MTSKTEIENQILSFRDALDSLNEGDTESVREWLVAAINHLESVAENRQDNWDRLIVEGVIKVGGVTDENTPESASARLAAKGKLDMPIGARLLHLTPKNNA